MNRAFGAGVAALVCLSLVVPLLGGVGLAQEDATPTGNETTVSHVNPDDASGEGDLGQVESYLARQLASRLSGSAVQISEGQYDRAKGLLGPEYRDSLAKYVDVAGETGNEGTAETFRETRERQRDFANSTDEYAQTLREYREAKRNGNEARARRLARELERQASNVTRTGQSVQRSYDGIANRTGANLTAAETAVNLTVANVTEQQTEIRSAEFVRTELSLSADSRRVSFADPLTVRGRLVASNGSALADREITLRYGNRTVPVRTDDDGRFSFRYRPVTLPVDADEATIRYVPDGSSIYLGTNASLPVSVTQVRSDVTITTATTGAAYNESVPAAARVTASGDPVSNASVALTVDGRQLATGRTNDEGLVSLRGRLPAGVATGDRDLRVAVTMRDRAVGRSAATRTLTVVETATTLTAQATPRDGRVGVRGRLRTADGAPVPGATIELRRDGSLVTTARTGEDGRYRATFDGTPGEQYRVVAVSDDPSTNLGRATAASTVAIPGGGDGGSGGSPSVLGQLVQFFSDVVGLGDALGGGDGLPTAALVGVGGALVVLLGGGGYLWWRRRGADEAATDAAVTPAVGSADAGPDAHADSTGPLPDPDELVETDAAAAVERAYRGVRANLHRRGLGSRAATHWEFYRACLEAGVEDREALERLTATYERAAFGRGEVDPADARTAVERAGRLV